MQDRERRTDAQLKIIVEGRCACWMCDHGDSPVALPPAAHPIRVQGEVVMNTAYDVTWMRCVVDVDDEGNLFVMGAQTGMCSRPVWLFGKFKEF